MKILLIYPYFIEERIHADDIRVPPNGIYHVAALLRERLSRGFIKEPHVSVFVNTYNSKKISVFGQVRKPGTFSYADNMSIVEAITLAGGFTPIASRNRITVTRSFKGQSKKINVPVADIGEGKAANYPVQPGDVVFVPERVF